MQFDVDRFLKDALAEDIGTGDHTTLSTIPADAKGKARLLVKDKGVLSGSAIAQRVFQLADHQLQFQQFIEDGSAIEPGQIAFEISGPSRSITMAERLVLNMMQRMSGIASKTARVVALLQGTHCKVLDTRKTTPGFRYFEKLAVKTGGGYNHRYGLYDMILIKDNHIDYAGGVHKALLSVNQYLTQHNLNLRVECEARSLDEVRAIMEHDVVFRVLLDNFSPSRLYEAVQIIGGRKETEASGGITEANCREYALSGVDYISMGELTHTVHSLDLSLKAVKD